VQAQRLAEAGPPRQAQRWPGARLTAEQEAGSWAACCCSLRPRKPGAAGAAHQKAPRSPRACVPARPHHEQSRHWGRPQRTTAWAGCLPHRTEAQAAGMQRRCLQPPRPPLRAA
jgi:hypothetical protein